MMRRRNAILSNDALDASDTGETRSPKELAKLEAIGETTIVTMIESMLTGADTAARLTELLDGVLSKGMKRFVLDLQNVAMMDSICVGALIELITRVQTEEHEPRLFHRKAAVDHRPRMALVNANRNVAYLFRITRLDRLFPICRDVMSALAAVEGRDPSAAGGEGNEAHGLMKALGF